MGGLPARHEQLYTSSGPFLQNQKVKKQKYSLLELPEQVNRGLEPIGLYASVTVDATSTSFATDDLVDRPPLVWLCPPFHLTAFWITEWLWLHASYSGASWLAIGGHHKQS
jgi:hypothetical protein